MGNDDTCTHHMETSRFGLELSDAILNQSLRMLDNAFTTSALPSPKSGFPLVLQPADPGHGSRDLLTDMHLLGSNKMGALNSILVSMKHCTLFSRRHRCWTQVYSCFIMQIRFFAWSFWQRCACPCLALVSVLGSQHASGAPGVLSWRLLGRGL